MTFAETRAHFPVLDRVAYHDNGIDVDTSALYVPAPATPATTP